MRRRLPRTELRKPDEHVIIKLDSVSRCNKPIRSLGGTLELMQAAERSPVWTDTA